MTKDGKIIRIVIEQKGMEYIAYVKRNPRKYATGASINMALGALLRSHAETFIGLSIEFAEGVIDTEGPAMLAAKVQNILKGTYHVDAS